LSEWDEVMPVKLERPTPVAVLHDSEVSPPTLDQTTLTVETPLAKDNPPASEIIYVKPYTPPQAPATQKRQRRRTKRKFRYPLDDTYAEKIAHQVYTLIKNMSLCNARRLVDTYGTGVTENALSRVMWLDERQSASNPAGLLITVVGLMWRDRHGWDVPKPVFKAEPKRKARRKKYDPRKGPITKSEAWLRWSIWFWYERGDMEAVEWRQARLVELGFEPEVLGDYGGGEEIGEIDFF
jgi:hypothetical protein